PQSTKHNGNGYTWPASSSGLTRATSNPFNIPLATITNVASPTANGSYKAGSLIVITVAFSEAVTVTPTPNLALNSGGTANYVSGSGTGTLTFNYTVQAGENSPDLDYTSTTALSGTIKDAQGNNATLTLPSPGAA